ncbi:MAG: alpha/beta hydrolase [Pseudomonadota bacterium]|nr:alpha/beta hydrolase [Pseudomonadota bacterium]
MKPFASRRLELRGIEHRILTWGPADAPKLFMLHGWMDVGASFQFLVDALEHEWQVLAPDLRGFGQTQWSAQGYWYADYIADLDALLERLAPDEQVNLIGHSLGGNVVMHYAGVRPERVAKVISLEGFGIPDEPPARAPAKLQKWLDAWRSPIAFADYADLGAVAERLMKNNPRLPRDKAVFLANEWAEVGMSGRARLRSDPRHKLPFPSVYRLDEVYAIWERITAPTLWIAALQSHIPKWLADHPDAGSEGLEGVRRRIRHVSGAQLATVDGAGHMLHHDQPEVVAGLIENFVRA